MFFSSLKIGQRLSVAFGVLMLLMVALVFTAATRFLSIEQQNKEIIQRDWVNAEAANAIDAAARDDARSALKLFTEAEESKRVVTYERIGENKKAINAALDVLAGHITSKEGLHLVDQIRSAQLVYQESFLKASKLLEEYSGDDAIRMLNNETFPALDALLSHVKSLVALQKKRLEANGAKAARDIQTSLALLLGLGMAALVTGLGFAIWITRSITRPLNQAVVIAQAVSKGDLRTQVSATSTDEAGLLLQALSEMNGSLAAIVGKVRAGAESISAASANIASDNAELVNRSHHQVSSLQQTSASMESLTSTVKQNAENAHEASELAVAASNIARQGGQVVGEVVQTMTSIKDSSRKIVDIISVIDGIAFQTNILALNAAVEAARAGEQGRGFAVVAAEVRNLAQRCASAAKEIKGLITDTVTKVDGGAQQVDKAGVTMDEIVVAIKRVADIVSEISSASQEQRVEIEQISRSISEIDRVTSDTSVVVESATNAAEGMRSQAAFLADAVMVFKLSGGVPRLGAPG